MVYIAINLREVTVFDDVPKLKRIKPQEIPPEQVKALLENGYTSCCNRMHQYPLELVKRRFGIDIPISNPPMRRPLYRGDKVILILFPNLSQLVPGGEMHTEDEIRKTPIFFTLRTIPRGF